MTVERPCEVCSGRSTEHLYDVNSFPIVRCRACGLVFAEHAPSPDELIALYDEAYYEDPGRPGYRGYGEAEERKRHHDRTLLDAIERLRNPGTLLEIGCAYGYFLDEARQRGWSVRGVEPSVHAAALARERFGLAVSPRPFVEVAVEPASLDAVVLWDVIEHLPNPRETLERAHAWLAPGGIVAISTGNVESLAARLHGADWSLMTPPLHQFYFARGSLRGLLERSGFEVVRMGGDGSVAVDPDSRRPRLRGPLASALLAPIVIRAARRLGAGMILFAFARKVTE